MDGGIASVTPGSAGNDPERRKKLFRLGALVAALSLGGAIYGGYVPVPAKLLELFSGKAAPSGPVAGGVPAAPSASATAAPTAAPVGQTPSAPAAPSVKGHLTAASGDGLGVALRLKDVSAPQPGDECPNAAGRNEDVGIQARTALGMLIGDSPVDCELSPAGAVCRLPDGTELNRRVVELGWATARAGSAYEAAESAARTSKRGLWGVCPSLK